MALVQGITISAVAQLLSLMSIDPMVRDKNKRGIWENITEMGERQREEEEVRELSMY